MTDTYLELPPRGPFYKYADNPIISTTKILPGNVVYESSSGKYWMVFTNFNAPAGVGVAYSTDLLTWTIDNAHLFAAPTDGTAPHLMLDGGTWYIFFGKAQAGSPSKISVWLASCATVNGTYTSGTEILTCGSGGTVDDERMYEPHVLKDIDGTYKMLYTGDASSDRANSVETLCLATATVITGPWTKYVSNPVIPWGASGSYDSGLVSNGRILRANGGLYVFYTYAKVVAAPWNTAVAFTTDLINYTKMGPVLVSGPTESADAGCAFRGGIIEVDGLYYFFYTGNENTTSLDFTVCLALAPSRSTRRF